MLKRYLRSLSLFVGITLIFAALSIQAAPLPPPSAKVTLDEYRQLIKDCVYKIPDLKTLWTWKSNNNVHGIYFGGGALRGLIRWINIQLSTHTLAEVRAMEVPPVDQLIMKKADRDLYTPDNYKKAIKEWQPYKNWDVLDETFYQQTIKNGGATIDKVRVSPSWIEDPFNAIELIYQGKIEGFFKRINFGPGSPIMGDSPFNLGLRYVRFIEDFKQIADPTPESVADLKAALARDANLLPPSPDTKLELSWESIEKVSQYRVKKALEKLYLSNGAFVFPLIKSLKEHGLFDHLAAKHYVVINVNFANPSGYLSKFRENGFDLKDMFKFGQMVAWTVPLAVEFHDFLIANSQNVDDLTLAISPLFIPTSEPYKKAISTKVVQTAKAGWLTRVGMTAKQAREIYVNHICCDVNEETGFLEMALETAISAQDFLDLVTLPITNPTEPFKVANSELILKHLGQFFEFQPSPSQVINLEQISNKINTITQLKKLGIAKAKSATELLAVLKPAFATPSEDYNRMLREVAAAAKDRFLSFPHTPSQVHELEARIYLIKPMIELKRGALLNATSLDHYNSIMKSAIPNPNKEYLAAIEELRAHSPCTFLVQKASGD